MVVIKLSASGQLGYYYNYWLDLNIDTNNLKTDNEAIEVAKDKILSNDIFSQDKVKSAESIETELVVESPNHYFEEREPKIEV
ncbi:MAG: hypothetical protein ACOC85_03230 [Thermoplasmatota archaeon]